MDGLVAGQKATQAEPKQYQPQMQQYQHHPHHHHHLHLQAHAQDQTPQVEKSMDMSTLAAALPVAADPQYLPRRQSNYDVLTNSVAFMSPPLHQTSHYSPGHHSMHHPVYLNHSPQQYYNPQYGHPTDHYSHLHRHLSAPMHGQLPMAHMEPYTYAVAHPPHSLSHSGIDSHQNILPTAFGVSPASALQRSSQHHSPTAESPSATFSFPRGPPRKPKQSGHALWVGNLPPATTVTALKDHFSREATKDIESLFLISKSNCAFVNYRTEEACVAALNRFHDSRFHGVRLVCRLRRSVPSPPATVASSSTELLDSTDTSPVLVDGVGSDDDAYSPIIVSGSQPTSGTRSGSQSSPTKSNNDGANHHERVPEKFYIVKSLTLQDLEASVRNGVWATQSHNEKALNEAFHAADNVYLIFSANKSGDYYGYARMTSAIIGDSFTVSNRSAEAPRPHHDGPKTIMTPATEHAPAGRVIDDSARGTIFWEAEDVEVEQNGDVAARDHGESGQDRGRQFKIEWLSTARLPFYRTRGLRNPWNANREVKIARDGTELEPSVGKRLLQMFHRPAQSPVLHPYGPGGGMYAMN